MTLRLSPCLAGGHDGQASRPVTTPRIAGLSPVCFDEDCERSITRSVGGGAVRIVPVVDDEHHPRIGRSARNDRFQCGNDGPF